MAVVPRSRRTLAGGPLISASAAAPRPAAGASRRCRRSARRPRPCRREPSMAVMTPSPNLAWWTSSPTFRPMASAPLGAGRVGFSAASTTSSRWVRAARPDHRAGPVVVLRAAAGGAPAVAAVAAGCATSPPRRRSHRTRSSSRSPRSPTRSPSRRRGATPDGCPRPTARAPRGSRRGSGSAGCTACRRRACGPGVGEVEPLAGPGDADVGEPALLLQLVGLADRAQVREHAVLEADEEHDRVLEALGRVQRHEHDRRRRRRRARRCRPPG